MFTIDEVKPLFTGIITTAIKYKGEITTAGGLLIDSTRLDGSLNPYQTIIAVGDMCKDLLKPGDIVKLNFKRYAKAQHVPGAIDAAQNKQLDNMSITYELPMLNLNGREALFLQSADVEYIVTKYHGVEVGGLLQ